MVRQRNIFFEKVLTTIFDCDILWCVDRPPERIGTEGGWGQCAHALIFLRINGALPHHLSFPATA